MNVGLLYLITAENFLGSQMCSCDLFSSTLKPQCAGLEAELHYSSSLVCLSAYPPPSPKKQDNCTPQSTLKPRVIHTMTSFPLKEIYCLWEWEYWWSAYMRPRQRSRNQELQNQALYCRPTTGRHSGEWRNSASQPNPELFCKYALKAQLVHIARQLL